MAWLGEYFLGEWVSIPLVAASNPDAAPTVTIYKANDTPVTGADTITMPPFAQGEQDGFFNRDVQLDANFSAGRYQVLVEYAISASNRAEQHFFQVKAGGNAKGAYVALHYYPRPHAKYLVGQLDDGTLEFRRGPKI